MFYFFSTRVMEFLTEYWEWNLFLFGRVFVGHLQSLKVGTLEKEARGEFTPESNKLIIMSVQFCKTSPCIIP